MRAAAFGRPHPESLGLPTTFPSSPADFWVGVVHRIGTFVKLQCRSAMILPFCSASVERAMNLVEEFTLDPLPVNPGRKAYQDRRSRLLHQGRNTGTVVPGIVLEAQIAADGGWLLFTTHDIPAEEGLEISLIDSSCKLVDGAALYWPYATGAFRNLVLASDDAVTFDFFGDHRWRVKLFDTRRLRPPMAWLIEPRGVHRKFGFSRRFAVGVA